METTYVIEKKPIIHDKKDKILLYISFIIGFLFCEFIFTDWGISVPIFITAYYAGMLWYMHSKERHFSRAGLWLFVPIALLTACFGLFNNGLLMGLNIILLYVLMLLHVAIISGSNIYPTFSVGTVLDLIHVGLALPILHMGDSFKIFNQSTKQSSKKRTIIKIIIGLVIAVPLATIVLALLANADDMFAKLLNFIGRIFAEQFWEYFFKIVIGFILSIPLFGLLYALRYRMVEKSFVSTSTMDKMRIADSTIIITVLTLLNLIYVAYIAVQFGYLFNVFGSRLPEDFTYTHYARQGFFELQAVAAINLIVLTIAYVFSKRNEGKLGVALKSMSTILVSFTMLIIATAVTKMILYVQAYGLTLLRVYTTWFMVLLFIIFVSILIKLYASKFKIVQVCCVTFLIMYLGLNYINIDAQIPKYNINRYHNTKATKLNIDMYYGLSDSAVPYIVMLAKDSNPTVAKDAKEYLTVKSESLDRHTKWSAFNLTRYLAQRAVANK